MSDPMVLILPANPEIELWITERKNTKGNGYWTDIEVGKVYEYNGEKKLSRKHSPSETLHIIALLQYYHMVSPDIKAKQRKDRQQGAGPERVPVRAPVAKQVEAFTATDEDLDYAAPTVAMDPVETIRKPFKKVPISEDRVPYGGDDPDELI